MNLNYLKNTYHLNKTELHILEYLYEEIQLNNDITIRKVAKNCFSSPTSIIRLAKKMNFSGYNELVHKMKESENLSQPVAEEIPTAYEIDCFCQLMDKHQNNLLIFLGNGFSTHLTSYMSEVLNFHYIPNITTSYTQLINNRKNQNILFIVVSHSGEEKSLIKTLKNVKQGNSQIISFLGNTNNTIAQLSDIVFSTNSYSPFSTTVAQPQLFFGRTLIIFEYLICAYINSKKS